MSRALMMERIAEASPRLKARIAGVFYLLTFLTGGVALFVRGRLGLVAGLIAVSGMVAVTLLLYDIFKPVNQGPLLARGVLQPRGTHLWGSSMESSGRGYSRGI